MWLMYIADRVLDHFPDICNSQDLTKPVFVIHQVPSMRRTTTIDRTELRRIHAEVCDEDPEAEEARSSPADVHRKR